VDVNKKYKAAVQCSTEDMIAEPVRKGNAVFNGNRVECFVCHARLMDKIYPHGFEGITGETGTEFMRQQEPRFVRKIESMPYHFVIKCKERKDGKPACNTLNIINL